MSPVVEGVVRSLGDLSLLSIWRTSAAYPNKLSLLVKVFGILEAITCNYW